MERSNLQTFKCAGFARESGRGGGVVWMLKF